MQASPPHQPSSRSISIYQIPILIDALQLDLQLRLLWFAVEHLEVISLETRVRYRDR